MTEIEGDPIADVPPVAGQASTGSSAIDEALKRLDGLDDLEVTEHPEQFDEIHRVLRESLTAAVRDESP